MSAPKGPALLVMAAGMGSRFGGLKQLQGLGPGGETLLEYSVYDALRAGFAKVVFLIRPEFEADFRGQVFGRMAGRIPEAALAYQKLDDLPGGHRPPAERSKPWGTAHAVHAAREQLDRPFGVLNADDFYGRKAFETAAGALAAGGAGQAGIVCCPLESTLSPSGGVSRAICELDGDGCVVGVEEHKSILRRGAEVYSELPGAPLRLPAAAPVSVNFWTFHPSLLPALEAELAAFLAERGGEPKAEFLLPELAGGLARSGRLRLKALEGGRDFFGITYPDDLPGAKARLRTLVEAGHYPERLWA